MRSLHIKGVATDMGNDIFLDIIIRLSLGLDTNKIVPSSSHHESGRSVMIRIQHYSA